MGADKMPVNHRFDDFVCPFHCGVALIRGQVLCVFLQQFGKAHRKGNVARVNNKKVREGVNYFGEGSLPGRANQLAL
jgi:hypothetical protein